MNVTTISEFRKNSKKYINQMISDHDILVIARTDGQSLVAMPLSYYNEMSETDYLLSNPANAKRLKKGLAEAKDGKTIKKTIQELRAYE